ncbi:uncharacterized protein C15orf39 homolog isoform X2 [Ambystoma mexicanum]|uniref:uncharacterized protein C15orf39 homolog isoform X2 n=1 Tax=Ambystoma mexicanum TaxID=8296 RepID=UPI0037E8F21C
MAGKRQLSYLDPVIFSKAPRLDNQPEHIFTSGLHKPNPMPGYTPEDLLALKNSYLAYPEASEHPHNWSTTAAYLQYAGSALNQHLRTEGMQMKTMLYRPDAESLKACLPPSDKGRSDIVRDLLIGRDKRASLMGRQEQLRQAQMHNFALQKPLGVRAAAPSSGACVPLAMPQPVYRNSVCCIEPGYNPRGPMSLGAQVEKVSKQPTGGEWMLPSQTTSGNQIATGDQRYATIAAMQKKAQQLESFLHPHPGQGLHSKDAGRMTTEYTSLQSNFEQFRGPQGSSFSDARYSVPYESPKRAQDGQQSNAVQKEWPSPHSLNTSLQNPQVPSYHDRQPPQSMLATQGQTQLFHHGDQLALRHSNSAFVPPSPSSYSGFCFPGSTDLRAPPDPIMYPASYFSQQGTRSNFLGPLESYPYRPNAAAPKELPAHLSLPSANVMPNDPHTDVKFHHSSGYKQDFLPQSTGFAFGPPDLPLYGNHLVDTNLLPPQPTRVSCRVEAPLGMPPAKEIPSLRTKGSQNSAFQPVQTANSTGKVAEGLLKGDLCYRSSPRQVEKPSFSRQSRSMGEMRRPSLTTESKSRDVAVEESSKSEPIIIEDSTSPEQSKTEHFRACVPNMSPKTPSVPSTPPQIPSAHKERQSSLTSIGSMSPSSPPMPVINNVFSLAPYRAYLEGTADHPFAKRQKAGKPPSETSKDEACHSESEGLSTPVSVTEKRSLQNQTEARPPDRSESNTPKLNLPPKRDTEGSTEAFTTCKIEQNRDNTVECQAAENIQQKSFLPRQAAIPEHKNVIQRSNSPEETTTERCQELREDEALDLSLKKNAPASIWNSNDESNEKTRVEGSEPEVRSDSQRVEVDTQTHLMKTNVYEKPQPLASPMALEKSHLPGAEGGFHSSAAFMFRKYKILKLCPKGSFGSSQQRIQPGHQNNHPMQQIVRVLPQPILQPLTQPSYKHALPSVSNTVLPQAPESSPVTKEPGDTSCKVGPSSCTQYFTEMHLSLCNFISHHITETPPEILQEWLRKVAPDEELRDRPKSPVRYKNGTRAPRVTRTSKEREIWLCFDGLPILLNKVLSQLETFILICKCPFPHVVRAGAIFIPIHLVKEKLFPGLSVTSVDRVLQEHKVELRPTTLSEEKLLRETELKGCSLRMLKLLALKQLPEIYPDLLDLHWHSCVRRQLGSSSQAGLHASK